MISLTNPLVVNTVLGSIAPGDQVNYDKLFLAPFTFNPANNSITASVVIKSSAQPNMPAIVGTFAVDLTSGSASLSVQGDGQRGITLSAGQKTAGTTILQNAQNALEAGLISLGFVAGTQSTGI